MKFQNLKSQILKSQILCLSLLAAITCPAASPKPVTVTAETNGALASPTNFFGSNIFAGSNVTIDRVSNGANMGGIRISASGGGGGGTGPGFSDLAFTNPATGLKLVDQSASVAEWNANRATIFLGFPPFPVLDPAAFSGDIFLWGAQPAQNLTNGFDIISIGDFPLHDLKSGSDVIALGDVVGGGLVTAKQTILIGNGGSVAGGSGAFTNVIIWGNSSSFPRLMLNVFSVGSSTFSFVGNADQALVSAILLGSDQSVSDTSGSYTNVVALGDGVQISGNGQMIFGNGISNYFFGTGATAGSVSNSVQWDNAGLTTLYGGLLLQENAMPTPVVGGGFLWNSNSALFWITSTKTNLVSDGQ